MSASPISCTSHLAARCATVVVAAATALAATTLGLATAADAATAYTSTTIAVPDNPFAIAIDQTRHVAYVTNNGGGTGNTVSVIDTATSQITDTLPVGTYPNGVTLDAGARTAYVTNESDATVSVIDTAAKRVTDTISVGRCPRGVASADAAHAVYVTNACDNSVSVIDTGTKRVTNTIGVGAGPIAVAVSPSAHAAYVANQDSDTVSVISTESGTVVDTVTAGIRPYAVAVDEGAHAVVVGNSGQASVVFGSVSIIDTATNKVVDTVLRGTSPAAVTVNPSTHTAYVAEFNGTVRAVDTRSHQLVGSIAADPQRAYAYGIAVDEQLHRIYVTNGYLNTVTVNAESTEVPPVSTTTTVGATPNAGVGVAGVLLFATVAPGDARGTVSFADGTSPIFGCGARPVTFGFATCVADFRPNPFTGPVAAGTHPITALYSGDGTHAASSGTLSLEVTATPDQFQIVLGQLIAFVRDQHWFGL